MTALVFGAPTIHAQPSLEWGGRAYVDYTYQLASDDPDFVGFNTFDYRRIYLTADADLDESFSSRVRLEMTGRNTLESGRPAAFVKDAWVRWQYAGEHRVTLGVQPPPLFQEAEAVWRYRSLERTLMDRTIRSSRDFGLRADGPLAGPVRYGVMFANGAGIEQEDDGARGKRVYGQLVARQGPFRATLGADYTSDQAPTVDGIDAPNETSARTSAFVGYAAERGSVGVEAFYELIDPDVPEVGEQNGVGFSVFGSVEVMPKTTLIGRYDFTDDDVGARNINDELAGVDEHFVLGAVAYQPIPTVWIMPNVIAVLPEGEDADVQGRLTVEFRF